MESPAGEIIKQCKVAMNEITAQMKTTDSQIKSALFDLLVYYRNMHQVADIAAKAEVKLRDKGIYLGTPPKPIIQTKRRIKRTGGRLLRHEEYTPSANGLVTVPISELTDLIKSETDAGGTPRFVLNLPTAIQPNPLCQPESNGQDSSPPI